MVSSKTKKIIGVGALGLGALVLFGGGSAQQQQPAFTGGGNPTGLINPLASSGEPQAFTFGNLFGEPSFQNTAGSRTGGAVSTTTNFRGETAQFREGQQGGVILSATTGEPIASTTRQVFSGGGGGSRVPRNSSSMAGGQSRDPNFQPIPTGNFTPAPITASPPSSSSGGGGFGGAINRGLGNLRSRVRGLFG